MAFEKFLYKSGEELALIEEISNFIVSRFAEVKHLRVYFQLVRNGSTTQISKIEEFTSTDEYDIFFFTECIGTANIEIFREKDDNLVILGLHGLRNLARVEITSKSHSTTRLHQNIRHWEPMTKEQVREGMAEIFELVSSSGKKTAA
jgi:hypothetical protein